jgi:2-polyprenyl-3-methyl-5-hydroxy-6-metoxy-1,4-benzoquinol methylase
MAYHNETYWNSLVGNEMKLQEVGWPQWTEAFNVARYKLTAKQTIESADLFMHEAPKNILEIGCGVGFWTSIFTNTYPEANYTGVDISEKAIQNLTEKFKANSKCKFVHADISKLNTDWLAQFDCIICMEVLLHITNKEDWNKSMHHICTYATNNAMILMSEPFHMLSQEQIVTDENNVIRKFSEVEEILAMHQLQIKKIQARTFLLDNNFDFKNKWSLQLWNLFFKGWNALLSINNESLGNLLGKIAFAFDAWYTKKAKIGHSSRLFIIKKS